MRIDAHQHFWQVARGDYGWLDSAPDVLRRDYGAADLAPHLARHGIGATILVQAAPTVAETRFMLATAREAGFVAGVVGWADLAAPDASSVIAELARDPLLVGLRPMVQDLPDDDFLADIALGPALRTMVRHGLVFDALVLPRHLSRLLVLAERHPDLAIVIDHGAKPFIRDGTIDPWRADMAALAALPNVACKLSGLVTEARDNWSASDLEPYVRHLVDAFGASRLIWGSDWPVVNRAGGYDAWHRAAEALTSSLAATGQAAIFGGNAARTYLRRAATQGQSGA
ncbi:MAG: amidohydrolase family protein [Phreatobacter sp.]|uniref:amidohydrolase family protein n=1 Tax=Phreatobacter sp. TaxID=1966341 RepID=UPI001A394599|nr:amidohydrolase family protein [Phreatobacter sp.]MBL8570692.1 amidohydrolase family protein [Phreatobacter sp.]